MSMRDAKVQYESCDVRYPLPRVLLETISPRPSAILAEKLYAMLSLLLDH